MTPVESEALISLLLRGDLLPVEIADDHGRHPSSVSRSLRKLKQRGLVADKGRGVYELTAPGVGEARRVLRVRAEEVADEGAQS